ncbi:hypothetical protein ZEAMMB73_Zm00001d004535 [Zea mays]|uniref:Uncharacterized protein n=1 Tax=Zea mays TaxID=4577 RepID=A0A1D6EFX8_MAIZE|nr:hypothetical protein ZEAMMB73_Zm00001d004535 [Zea mays]ONM19085.1 hypothetical protein ZEAMMB73_Zm00001d004535 [Zea mays]
MLRVFTRRNFVANREKLSHLAKGLKLGLYSDAGTQTCSQKNDRIT